MKHKPAVYWITGLSGSGKTTLATALTQRLRDRGQPTILLDGDILRALFNTANHLDREARLTLSMQYAKLCHHLLNQQINVVCSTISLFHEIHAWNRQHLTEYYEIFLDIPMRILEQRDSKHIYAKAKRGEMKHVVGIDIVPEFPINPDLVVDHAASLNTEHLLTTILNLSTTPTGETHESSCL